MRIPLRTPLFLALFILIWNGSAQAQTGKLAFASKRADFNQEIYLENIDGTGVQRLTYESEDDIDPALSPDGTKVAFVSQRGIDNPRQTYDLFVVNVDGTGLQKLSNYRRRMRHPVWSPDGTRILVVAQPLDDEASQLCVFTPSSGAVTQIGSFNTRVGDTRVQWSNTPQGEKIFFYLVTPPETYVPHSINPDGSGDQVVASFRIYSADGSKYAVQSYDFGPRILIYKASDNSKLSELGAPYGDSSVAFTVDGQYLVTSGYGSYHDPVTNLTQVTPEHINIYSVLGGYGLELTHGAKGDFNPSTGPGSTVPVPVPPTGSGRLALVTGSGVYTMNPAGWGVRRLSPIKSTGEELAAIVAVVWNKQGTRLAVRSGNTTYTMAADGGDLQAIAGPGADAATSAWNATFSPSGSSIAYQYNGAAIHIKDLTGAFEYDAGVEFASFVVPFWSPATATSGLSYLAYYREGGPYGEYAISVAQVRDGVVGAPFGLVTNRIADNTNTDIEYGLPAWMPDARHLIAFRKNRSVVQQRYVYSTTLLSLDTTNGAVQELATGIAYLPFIFSRLSVSPDGAQFSALAGPGVVITSLTDFSQTAHSWGYLGSQYDVNWGANTDQITPDTTAPTLAITSPSGPKNITQLSIGGTVTDDALNGSDVATVRYSLKRIADGKYWNPAGLTAAEKWSSMPIFNGASLPAKPGVVGDSYQWTVDTYNFVPPSLFESGEYQVTAFARDNSGNTSAQTERTFSITTPAAACLYERIRKAP